MCPPTRNGLEKHGGEAESRSKKELAAKRRQLTQAERRIEELDRLFKRIYEDNANGKLSDSRFQMLSDEFELVHGAMSSLFVYQNGCKQFYLIY